MKAEVGDKKQVLLRMTSTELRGADRLYPRVTIDALSDNVLLDTFDFYLGKDDPDRVFANDHNYDGWQTLVHVCRRWRFIVFASPRRLDLKLYCTPQRSVNSKTLDIWPELPIVICAEYWQYKEDVTNVISALRHHNRVCKINDFNRQFQNSLLKELAAIDQPFPALTSLTLTSYEIMPVLPDSFLGGSAPRLRTLELNGIPYPSIGKLLSSTTNLVRLSLWHIPHSGYVSPKTIVPSLSTLARLETLELGFKYARSRAHRPSRHPPPLARVGFPNLSLLRFSGDVEYLEDILSQIETPTLNLSKFILFNQLVFDTPLLGHFICRTETFMTIHTARVEFGSWSVKVALSEQEEMANNDVETLWLSILCKPLDWQLSAVVQVLNSFLSSLSTLECLDIAVSHEDWQGAVSRKYWQDEIEVIQWREFLHLFTSVKEMSLIDEASVRLVSPALQELTGERATEVLPALQNLSIMTSGWSPSGPLKEAIEEFIATRQLYGQPVILHYQDPKSEV